MLTFDENDKYKQAISAPAEVAFSFACVGNLNWLLLMQRSTATLIVDKTIAAIGA
ncbi:hypothetical protein N9Y42_01105 [Mariniblastus sp.]|nr:hypothetical protein [Mariniblastus sp.]